MYVEVVLQETTPTNMAANDIAGPSSTSDEDQLIPPDENDQQRWYNSIRVPKFPCWQQSENSQHENPNGSLGTLFGVVVG